MADLIQTAHDLSLRAIEQQEKRLNELRVRGGTLLAAAAIAASVLGAQAARAGTIGVLGALAILAFVVSVLTVLYVIWPHRLVLEFRGSVLLDVARQHEASSDAALEASIDWIEAFHQQNRAVLERLATVYAIACIAVGVEIILWTISVTGSLN